MRISLISIKSLRSQIDIFMFLIYVIMGPPVKVVKLSVDFVADLVADQSVGKMWTSPF